MFLTPLFTSESRGGSRGMITCLVVKARAKYYQKNTKVN